MSRARFCDRPRPIISSSLQNVPSTSTQAARCMACHIAPPWRRARARRARRARGARPSITSATLSPGTGESRLRRVRRGLSRHRQRAPAARPARRRPRNPSPSGLMRAPLDAAVVGEHAEDRIAARQVGVRGVGAPDRPGPGRLAQHVETGGVVDLAVHQHDAARWRVSRAARAGCSSGWRRSWARMSGEALTSAQSCGVAAAHGDRGLGSRPRAQRAAAHAGAVAAVAVPLGKAAAGGRPQYANLHSEVARRRRSRRRLAPRRRAASPRSQRFAMYIVISMPKRKSMACGVSHFISQLLVCDWAALAATGTSLPRAPRGESGFS